MIILFTGSRDWRDVQAIGAALIEAANGVPRNEVTVRHGMAKGADTIAHVLAQWFGMNVDPMPADWPQYGHKAGPIRNARMVNTFPKVDRCVACILDNSSGASHCADLAERAGIPTRRYNVRTGQ